MERGVLYPWTETEQMNHLYFLLSYLENYREMTEALKFLSTFMGKNQRNNIFYLVALQLIGDVSSEAIENLIQDCKAYRNLTSEELTSLQSIEPIYQNYVLRV
jgi:hypothetical protein